MESPIPSPAPALEQPDLAPSPRSPSLRKITLLFLLLVAPLVLASVCFLLYSFYTTQEAARNRIQTAVESQLENIDGNLSLLNLYLSDLLLNNSQVKTIVSTTREHTRNVAGRALLDELDDRWNFWSTDYNFLFALREEDFQVARLIHSNRYADCDEIRRRILSGVLSPSGDGNPQSWETVLVEDRVYFIQMYEREGAILACWTPAEALFSFLPAAVLTDKGSYLLLDQRGFPLMPPAGKTSPSPYTATFTLPRASLRLQVMDAPYVDRGNLVFLLLFICVIFLILLGVSLYTLTYFRRYIERPFRQFQQHIEAYSSLRSTVRQRGFAELNQAVTAFDSLSTQLKELKIDIYEEKLALAKTQLEYFQIQIRPHFFVNCFSILFSMAQKKEYERIQTFCYKLSNYVRYLFTDGFHTVPLRTELEMVQEYLDIQSIRHRMEFSMEDTVEEVDLNAREIPPLLLLTFVENAVKHAQSDSLSVCVRAARQDDRLWLRVWNSGQEIPEALLEKLNRVEDYDENFAHTNRGVGIRNIVRRLSLLYGNRFSLTFINENQGVAVELTLPLSDTE